MVNLAPAIRAAKRAEMASGSRTCTRCGKTKPLAEFYPKSAPPWVMAECCACFCLRAAEVRRRAVEKRREARWPSAT